MTRRDLVLELGPVSSEPDADVSGVLSSPEASGRLGEQLRSLAHPGWPYVDTEHVWRGFENRYQKLKFGPELP